MAPRLAPLALTVAAVGALTLATAPAGAAQDAVTASATVTVSQTGSYTATESSPVSATASWGLPAISQTATDTTTASATETATESATVTATGTGQDEDSATDAAQASARLGATIQAHIAAVTSASYAASVAAHQTLVGQMIALRQDLYAQALTAAKAAAVARSVADPASTTPDAPVTDCGATVLKADGTPWTCTLDDEFTGSTLDTSTWTAWDGVNWWGDANMCYENDPDHVAVGGGVLTLSVTRNTDGEQCRTPDGTTTPAYLGANVTTRGKFAQQYGRFEARIRYSGTYGVHNNFWLYANDDSSTGAEIDVAEAWGATADQMVGATHVVGAKGTDAGDWNTCGIPQWSAGFHTYAVEWTPQTVSFIYDDNPCATWTVARSSFATPGSFDQKLFLILSTLADDGSYAQAPDASSQFPASTQIDWVRVWK